MGVTDTIMKVLLPEETEEEKKKRLEKQMANNPLFQFANRKNKIDKAIEDAQK